MSSSDFTDVHGVHRSSKVVPATYDFQDFLEPTRRKTRSPTLPESPCRPAGAGGAASDVGGAAAEVVDAAARARTTLY